MSRLLKLLSLPVIFVCCLVFCGLILPSAVHASSQTGHVDRLAQILSKPVYDLDEEQIRSLVENYLTNASSIHGVVVTENLENDVLLTIHNGSSGDYSDGGTWPEEQTGLSVTESQILYRNEVVGKVSVYLSNVSKLPLTQEEQIWLANNPEISIGVEQWYPFIRRNANGDIEGIAADFIALVMDKTGLRPKIVSDLWTNLLSSFQSGQIDLLPATYFTEERATYGLYSQPYFTGREFLFVLDDNTTIKGFEDLRGRKLAIPKDFGTIPKVREAFPDIEIVETEGQLDSVHKVLSGEVDAAFEQQIVFEQVLFDELITGIRSVPQTAFDASQLFFFSNINEPILHSILNKALNSITEEERRRIVGKWLRSSNNALKSNPQTVDNDPDGDREDDLSVFRIVGIAIVGVFIVSVLVSLILSRSHKTKDISKIFGSGSFRFSIICVLGLLVVMVVAINWVSISETKQRTEDQINRELQIILNISIDRIADWVTERKAFLTQLGRDQHLVDAARILVATSQTSNGLQASPMVEMANTYLDTKAGLNAETYFVIAPNYTTILSHSDLDIGSENPLAQLSPQSLERAFRGEAVFIPPIPKSAESERLGIEAGTMYFIVPILGPTDGTVALFAKVVRVEADLSENLRLSRVGESGETYAVSAGAKMLTESRFKQDLVGLGFDRKRQNGLIDIDVRDPGGNLTTGYQATHPMNERPLTVMMESVLGLRDAGQGTKLYTKGLIEKIVHPGNIEGYSDYRGVKVVGVWAWLDDLGFGLTSELDHEEAYADYFAFRRNLILISGISTLLAIGATLFTLLVGQRSHRALEKAYDELEDRVDERTLELQKSEIRSRSIVETAADAILVIDQSGFIQTFSPSAERMFGYHVDEVVGQNIKMLMPSSIAREHDGYLARYRETGEKHIIGKTREAVGRRKNGEEFALDLAVAEMSLGEERLYTGIVRDISERKEAEEALARSEERSRLLLSSVGDGIFGVDLEGKVTFINPSALALLGYKEHEVIGQPIHDLIHHTHADGTPYPLEDCPMHRSFTLNMSARIDDEVLWRKDGTHFPVEYNATPILRDQTVIGAVVSFRDLSVIVEKEAQLRTALDNMTDGIYMLDGDLRLQIYNERYEDLVEFPKGLIQKGREAIDIIKAHLSRGDYGPIEDPERHIQQRLEGLASSQSGSIEITVNDGEKILEIRKSPVEGGGAVIIATDMTERIRSQEQLTAALELVSSSINYASKIQQSALPDRNFITPLLADHFLWWEPRDVVGGDLYWFGAWGDGCLIAVGDCTGHGVPGAFMTLISIAALETAMTEVPAGETGRLLGRTHQYIQKKLGQHYAKSGTDDGIEMSALYFVPGDGKITYSGARFDLLITDENGPTIIKGTKKGMGYRNIPYAQQYEQLDISIQKGQQFYLSSDGAGDQIGGPRNRMFGRKRMLNALQENRHLNMADQQHMLMDTLKAYQGDQTRRDDIVVLGMRFVDSDEDGSDEFYSMGL